MLAASLTPSRLPFLCELCALCVKIRLPPRAPVSSDLPAKSLRIRTYAKQPPNPCRIRTYKKTGGGAPWRRLQSVLPTRLPSVGREKPCAIRRNPCNPNLIMRLLHNLRTPRGWGICRSSLQSPTVPCISSLSLFLLGFRLSTVDCQPSYSAPIQRRLHNAHSPKMLKYPQGATRFRRKLSRPEGMPGPTCP